MIHKKLATSTQAMGLTAIYSPFIKNTSSSRLQMLTSQLGQIPVITNSEIPKIMTGFESQLSKYTFGVKASCDFKVIKKIPRLINNKNNPSTLYIYQVLDEELDRPTYGCFEVKSHVVNHELFGFESIIDDDIRRKLETSAKIDKDTVISHSSNVKENGLYGNGINAMSCYIADEAVIEDGVVISEELAENYRPLCIDSVSFESGATEYLLGIHSEPGKPFKVIPDIGDIIKPDGVIAAIRKRDDLLDSINMQENNLHVATADDKIIYADDRRGEEDAVVINVEVIDSENNGGREKQQSPLNMVTQLKKYSRSATAYYDTIINFYENKKREEVNSDFTPELLFEITRAYKDKPNDASRRFPGCQRDRRNVKLKYRGRSMKEFRVTITYAWLHKIQEQTKVTNRHAGKGIVIDVRPRKHMPRDKFGRVADIAYYGGAGIRRLNSGQFYEQYIDNHSDTVIKYSKRLLSNNEIDWNGLFNLYSEYLSILSPPMNEEFIKISEKDKKEYIEHLFEDGLYVHMPAENQWCDLDMVRKMEAFMPCERDKITYFNKEKGEYVETDHPVMLGNIYLYILEKSAPKGLAVSTSRTQTHGLPAVPNPGNRNSSPSTEKASKAYSETEVRLGSATTSPETIAGKIDYSTNPRSAYIVSRKIAQAENPAIIDEFINRGEFEDDDPEFTIPISTGMPQTYLMSVLTNLGMVFDRVRSDGSEFIRD